MPCFDWIDTSCNMLTQFIFDKAEHKSNYLEEIMKTHQYLYWKCNQIMQKNAIYLT